jgi:hypothetical protein
MATSADGALFVRPMSRCYGRSDRGMLWSQSVKIIQIGFNKCGTRTLHRFFRTNGIPGVHWDEGRLALTILRNVLEGSPPFSGYEENVFYSDMEAFTEDVFVDAYKFFPLFHRRHPDAVFILNTRSRDAWINSRLQHVHGEPYVQKHMRVMRTASEAETCEAWARDWDRHHQRVREYFATNGGRLIEFHIEREGPEKLAEAIPELSLDPAKYVAIR